jgi:hypothetical protein
MACDSASCAAATGTLGAVWKVKRNWPKWRRRALCAGVFGTGWLAVAPFGIGAEHTAALVGVECMLAARWWQAIRLGYPSAPISEPGPAVEDEPLTGTQIMHDWDAYIGNQSGKLPESRLTLPQPTRYGYAYSLRLARGKQTLTDAVRCLEHIASGLDVDVADVIVESDPTHKSPARCRFQLLTDSPIKGDVVFDGPRRRGGFLDLGPWADGSGEAPYRLYTPGSMWSGVVIGGTGIGKSRVIENIAISALSGGDTEFWFIDPQRGVSSPALARHADWFGTMDDATDMLQAALAILEARGDESSYEGWTGFTPSPDRPGLLIIIDECHNVFELNAIAKLWGKIAREGRKVGVALLCVSQYPGLETFGGVEALRSSVMEGNAIVLRSTSHSTGQLMPGLQVDPKTLPKIPGYAYVQGSAEAGTRTAPFRNRDTGKNPEPWLAAQPRPGLETLAVTATRAAGTAYLGRHTSTDSVRSASAARVKALREGHLPADMLLGTDDTRTVPMGEMGELIAFPRPLTAEDLHRTAAASTELSPSHQDVLNAVAAGASSPSEVEKYVGLKPRRIATLLKDLVASGHLVQPSYGRYERAA